MELRNILKDVSQVGYNSLEQVRDYIARPEYLAKMKGVALNLVGGSGWYSADDLVSETRLRILTMASCAEADRVSGIYIKKSMDAFSIAVMRNIYIGHARSWTRRRELLVRHPYTGRRAPGTSDVVGELELCDFLAVYAESHCGSEEAEVFLAYHVGDMNLRDLVNKYGRSVTYWSNRLSNIRSGMRESLLELGTSVPLHKSSRAPGSVLSALSAGPDQCI